MMYSTKGKWIPTEELIGKFIHWKNIRRRVVVGTKLDVIPANTKPTEEKVIDFYGEHYPKDALRAFKFDRVKVYDVNQHKFVLPLSDKRDIQFEIKEK